MKRKSLLFLLLFALIAPFAANAQQTLTVHDGTGTNSNVPIHGIWADAYLKCEMVYPAAELGSMSGGTINSIKFYASTPAAASWGNANFQVFVAEVDYTTISDFAGPGTIVYEGALDGTQSEMEITFSSPYAYNGGNLLVGVYNTVKGTYKGITWAGETVSGASVQGYSSSSLSSVSPTQRNFLPKTTFNFTNTSPYIALSPSAATVFTGFTTTLTATYGNVTGTPTITYTSSDNNVATVIGDGTTATVTAVAPGTATITATMNGTYTATCAITVENPSYCSPAFSSTSDYIASFTLGDISNTSSDFSTGGYGDFTTMSTDLEQGEPATASLTSSSGSGTHAAAVWIDFDDSYTFEDSERVGTFDGIGASATVAIDVTIPSNAAVGSHRMRVLYQYNVVAANMNPCASASYGEAEDYTVVITAPSNCKKPTDLAAGTPTGRTVELSWTENGEATAWQICLNGDETNPIPAPTNPFTLTGLTPETPYTVKVRAYCDAEDQSKWSNEVSFTTDVACPTPKITDVTTTPTSAVLTWTGTASEYEMQYAAAGGILQYGFEEDLQGWTNLIVNEDGGEWLHSSNNQAGYDYTEVAHTGTGFAMCFSFVDDPDAKFDPGAYNTDAYLVSPMAYQINAGASLNFWYDMANDYYPEYFEVCVATVANPTASDFTAIWTLPTEDEKTGRHEQVRHLDRTRYDNWREVTIDLSDYVGQTIWIAFHDVNEDMYELWLDDVTVNDGNEVTWIPIPGYVTSPYTWEPLDPETSYMVRLRAVCGGEDGVSEWVMTTVTTLSACAAPNALNVPNVTLMPESATLAWTGYQDSYQVRYRTVGHTDIAEGSFFEDFESGSLSTKGWTVVRQGEGTEYTDWRIFEGNFSSSSIPPHSGQYVVMGRSWSNTAYNVDNWLISPQISLDGTLSYWVIDDGQYHEHYDVYVSTTTNDVTAFTLLYEPGDASDTWTEHTVDLSSYAGQQGYIAFRLVDYDQDWLFLDDITIGSIVEVPAGEWITVTVNDTLAPIDRLDAETEYEWQVMGLNCSGTNNTEWSEIATFTTPGYCDNPNHIVFDELTATSATISWTGYQDSYNVWYRTAAVEEFFYEDFSNGAAGWAGANMNEDSDTYTLGSGEDAYNAFGFVGDDNAQTLISPTIEGIVSGSTLSFLYYDFSQGATPQTFSVGFATVDEITNLSQFTFGETFTTSTEDYINYYEIEVPEGAKHFAIQCTSGSGSYLFVTDFWIYGPNYQAPGEFVQMVVETNSATLAPLTGETEYEVYVQGICGEGEEDVTYWVGGSFWTPVQTNITQTITLAQGTNWVSFYVNTNLDALKAALETTGLSPIVIKAKNDGQTTYNGARWRGALNTLDFAQMYKIDVPEDCEISLEGMPLDASQITITIKTGDNWIGFPFAQNMTVTEAFASIAINTDAVRSKDGGQATYNGTRWRGALNTLVPGQGYIYRSAVLEDTPFVYPTSSKRNAQNETAVLSSHKMTTRNKSFKAVSSFKALSTSKVNQNPTIK